MYRIDATRKGIVLAAVVMMFLTGCAHKNLEVNTQTNGTIFLNADVLSQGKPIYLLVRDQTSAKSGGQSLESLVVQKLQAKGYHVTKNAKAAAYRMQANFLYMDRARDTMTSEGALAGGFGGAVVGGAATGSATGVAVGSSISSFAGGIAGSMMGIDTWYGIVDIQIEEPLPHAVKKKTRSVTGQGSVSGGGQAQAKSRRDGNSSKSEWNGSATSQGTGEVSTMEYEESATHKKMQMRVVSEAKQTNIEVPAAEKEIKDQLSNAIANFF